MSIGEHHLSIRRRIYENLEEYPHPMTFQRRYDYLMYVVGSLAPLALLPQVIHLYTLRNAAGLSLTTWILLTIINSLWAMYGFLHKERPIMTANLGMATLDLVMLIGVILYR